MTTEPHQPEPSQPWWRMPILWLVLGGPAVVVVAGVATAVIAIRHADTVVAAPVARVTPALQPAVQARNHAATPQR
jgi:hypothetical protein